MNLKGNVKKIQTIGYTGIEVAGKISKGKREEYASDFDDYFTFNSLGYIDSAITFLPETNSIMSIKTNYYNDSNYLLKSSFSDNSGGTDVYLEYLTDGNVVTQVVLKDSIELETYIYTYSDSGLLMSLKSLGPNNSYETHADNKYNKAGQLVKSDMTSSLHDIKFTTKHFYDKKGHLIKSTSSGMNGLADLIRKFEYEFDSKNNWIIKKVEVISGSKSEDKGVRVYYVERIIEYY